MTVQVVASPNWDKLIKRYTGVADQPRQVMRGVVSFAQDYMIQESTHFLDVLVYDTPQRGKYERTRNTRRAIRKLPIEGTGVNVSGVVHVDASVANRDGFFYPAVLNRGMRKYPRYYPRPFWTAARAMVQTQFRLQGRKALEQLKKSFQAA